MISSEKIRLFFAKTLLYLLLAVLSAVMLLPFYMMLIMGSYDSNELYKIGLLPSVFFSVNFRTVMQSNILCFFKNSFAASGLSTVLALLTCSLCGYGLAKFNFRGRAFLYRLILFTMMIPSQLGIVAYVWEMRQFKLNNTLWPIILPYLCLGFGAFWMTQYIRDAVPNEIIESARIDGAGELRIFFSIVTHLITPALITLGLLAFVWSWNSFFIPLVTISDSSLYTVPLGISSFNTMYASDTSAKVLALSLATMPVLVIYIIFSRQMADGLTAGAVKG